MLSNDGRSLATGSRFPFFRTRETILFTVLDGMAPTLNQ